MRWGITWLVGTNCCTLNDSGGSVEMESWGDKAGLLLGGFGGVKGVIFTGKGLEGVFGVVGVEGAETTEGLRDELEKVEKEVLGDVE